SACIANRLFVLSDKLASDLYVNWTYVINVDCLSLDSRELTAIVHRSSHLSATVVDVLIHHTRSLFLSYSEQSIPGALFSWTPSLLHYLQKLSQSSPCPPR
ncbi:unnamed protein product, partial [Brassica oleracea var. botrytis]